MGVAGPAMLGAGAGLLGGALLADVMTPDVVQQQEIIYEGGDGSGDYGGGGDFNAADFGGGDVGGGMDFNDAGGF